MKLFNITAAMMMLAMSALLGTNAMAFTAPVDNCSVLKTNASVPVAVGSVCVKVDDVAKNVRVNYFAEFGWKLSEVKVFIGVDEFTLRANLGTNTFTRSDSGLVGIAHSYTIPFSDLNINEGTFCNADVLVAANAVVTRTVAGSGGGKSEKSVKSAKGSKADKSAKNSKGSKDSKKEDKNGKGKDSSAKSGKGNTQTASTSSSKSSKSTKSGKSGKSGASTGGGTGPVTETATAWAGDIPVGIGYYFSFKNDFCVTPPPPAVVKLFDAACYNVFAGIPGTATPFAPAGFSPLDPAPGSGWINTFLQPVLSTSFLRPNNAIAANLTALAIPGSGQLIVDITSVPLSYKVSMSNIYYGPSGSFNNVSPLSYGISTIGTGAARVIVTLPGQPYPNADLVVHAMICPTEVSN